MSAGIVSAVLPVLSVVALAMAVVATVIMFVMARRPANRLLVRRWALLNYLTAGLFAVIAVLRVIEQSWLYALLAVFAAVSFAWTTRVSVRRYSAALARRSES